MIGFLFLFSSCATINNILPNKKENLGNGVILEMCGDNEAIIYFDSKIDPFDFKSKMEAYDQISYVHTGNNIYNDIIAIQKNIFYEWIDVEAVIVSYYIELKVNSPIEDDLKLNDSKNF